MPHAIAVVVGFGAAVVALSLLGLKWALGVRVVLLWSIGVGVVAGAITYAGAGAMGYSGWQAVLIVPVLAGLISAATLAWRFFRDPERVPPRQEGVVVAPADGKVIYVRKITRGTVAVSEKKGSSFPLSDLLPLVLLDDVAWLVGISMSFLDVHVNRAPIAGNVARVVHIPGRFLSLRKPQAVFVNERMLTVVDGGWLRVAVVQIASRLVRRIVGYVTEGTAVGLAQRIGKITLGSQVDLVMTRDSELSIVVQPGQHVKAGQSVIAARIAVSAGHKSQKGVIS